MPRLKPFTRLAGISRLPKSALAVAPLSVVTESTTPVLRSNVTEPTTPSASPSSVMTGSPTHSTQASQSTPSALQAARLVAAGSLLTTMRPSSIS